MRPMILTIVLCLAVACSDADQGSIPPPAATAPTTGETSASSLEVITVEARFPASRTLIVGDVAGRVTNDDGQIVAEFEFESGWVMAQDWQWGDDTEPSGAATAVSVELPEPGRYTFAIDPYTLSHAPCGTCETFFAETAITQDVINGSMVQIPPGDNTGES